MKIQIFAVVALMCAACGNKTGATSGAEADSTGVTEVPDTLHSVEAVIRQVNAVYDYWNDLREHYDENKPTVDELFGSKEWQQVRSKVEAIDRECECGGYFDFGDNGPLNPWIYDCFEGRVSADSISAKLLPDGSAEVNFLVRDAVTIQGIPIRWLMRVEECQWRVADIFFVQNNNLDLLSDMQSYADNGGAGAENDASTDISEMPKSAKQMDSYFQYAVYVNKEQPANGEAVYFVWLAEERTGTVQKLCVTNPQAEAQWQRMKGPNANGVTVPLSQIASAERAWIAPGDVSKVIVEGCPDGRNIWTYIIDSDSHTAIQLPSTEGVQHLEWEKKEIVTASYGYDNEGRYSYQQVFSLDGKFLRRTGEIERE